MGNIPTRIFPCIFSHTVVFDRNVVVSGLYVYVHNGQYFSWKKIIYGKHARKKVTCMDITEILISSAVQIVQSFAV